MTHDQAPGQFTGQPATAPGRYQILFIHEGEANGFTFSRQVLQESVALWEGASVFVDHSYWAPQSVRDLGGVLSNAAWSEEFDGLTAELTPAGPSKEIIREAAEITMRDGPTPNMGFSADVVFTADATGNVTRILQPYSVDLVDGSSLRHQVHPHPQPERKELQCRTDSNHPHRRRRGSTAAVTRPGHTLNALVLDTALAVSDIPDKAKDAIRLSFKTAATITPADVTAAIQAWKDAIAEATAGAEIKGPARVSAMFNSRRPDPGRS